MNRDFENRPLPTAPEAVAERPMNGHPNGTEIMTKSRARKEAAKVLGVALQARYRKFLESAGDETATVVATADLAQCMYENVEFVIWALKHVGGLNPPPPMPLRAITPPTKIVANDEPQPLDLPCTCPPLEHGIIGRDKHMTSCPKFKP